jgi:predicted lipoprotein
MKRIASLLCLLALVCGLSWHFPLFHIVRLGQHDTRTYSAPFNASEFVKTFWSERLVPSLQNVPDVATVLAAFHENSHAASGQFGRKVSVSRVSLFMVRGSGTIVTVDDKGVGMALQRAESQPDLLLHTGLLFGNLVRDASGLLDPSDFSNSQHFNDISTELNRLVEAQVIPKLKGLAVAGRKIQFVGCAEVSDDLSDVRPLRVIVLDVNIE